MSVPEDIAAILSKYSGPERPRPAGWEPQSDKFPWPPFGEWPPDPIEMAKSAFRVLTGAYAEGVAAAAMRGIERRYEEINSRLRTDNLSRAEGDRTPEISWTNPVASLVGVNHGTIGRWRREPWKLKLGDFCRLALLFGLPLAELPEPTNRSELLAESYARAVNWLLLQLRDGPISPPDANALRDTLAAGDYAQFLHLVGRIPAVDGPLIRRLRTDVLTVAEYEDYFEQNPTGTDPPVDSETIAEIRGAYRKEHLDAYEAVLDLLFQLSPLDPLGEDPIDPDRDAEYLPEAGTPGSGPSATVSTIQR